MYGRHANNSLGGTRTHTVHGDSFPRVLTVYRNEGQPDHYVSIASLRIVNAHWTHTVCEALLHPASRGGPPERDS